MGRIPAVSMEDGIIRSLDHADLQLVSLHRRKPRGGAKEICHLSEKRNGVQKAFNFKIEPFPGNPGAVHTERALTASSTVFFMVKTRSSRVSLNILVTGSVAPQRTSSLPFGMRLKMDRIAPNPLLSINSTWERSRTTETTLPLR